MAEEENKEDEAKEEVKAEEKKLDEDEPLKPSDRSTLMERLKRMNVGLGGKADRFVNSDLIKKLDDVDKKCRDMGY